jgi:hypothetical protein
MPNLFYLLAAVLIAIFSFDTMRAREAAIRVAKVKCQNHDIQLLDQSVVLVSVKPCWTQQGFRLKRSYHFDYSLEGVEREQGKIAMVGSRLVSIEIAHLERVKDITPL